MLLIFHDFAVSEDCTRHNTNGACEARHSVFSFLTKAAINTLQLFFLFFANRGSGEQFFRASPRDSPPSVKNGLPYTAKRRRKTMRVPRNTLSLTGLDWPQAIQRYVPRIVVCQRCHTYCTTGVERAERMCTFHLYACGLGMQMDAAHYRLVTLLERRVAFLQTHPDLPSL